MPEVMVILKSLLTATRTVIFTLVLLGAIIYVFAIFFTELAQGTSLEHTYFRDVSTSMHTLLVAGAFPDNDEIMWSFAAENIILWIVFLLFILLAAVTIMNMTIGVLVDVVKAASVAERETIQGKYLRDGFMDVLRHHGYVTDESDFTSLELS